MTVYDIVEKYLKENGYDGLYLPGVCSCTLKDGLRPCGCLNEDCKPGYLGMTEDGPGIVEKKDPLDGETPEWKAAWEKQVEELREERKSIWHKFKDNPPPENMVLVGCGKQEYPAGTLGYEFFFMRILNTYFIVYDEYLWYNYKTKKWEDKYAELEGFVNPNVFMNLPESKRTCPSPLLDEKDIPVFWRHMIEPPEEV